MCDYCDCHAIPEIGELSDEHTRLLALTGALKRTASAAETAQLLQDLSALLAPHTDREEAGVFAILADVTPDPDYRKHFLDEHDTIGDLLDAAHHDHDQVVALVETLERHILDEETDLYPAIRQLFSPADWHAVDHLLGRAHHHSAA